MKKRIMALLMVMLMTAAMVLTSCGQKQEAPAPAPTQAPTQKQEQKPAEITGDLRILWPGTSELEKKLAVEIQNEVKKQYPKVNIEFMYLSWGDIEKKLAAMTQAKDYPDLMMIQDVTNPVAMDALEPLDGYYNDKIKKDMFLKAPLEYMQVDGKQYAIPSLAVVYSHVVNKDMFQAAGVKPEDLKNWDDLKKAAKAMTKDGKFGYAMANGGEGRFTFRDFMMVCLSNGITPDDVSDKAKKQYIEVLSLFNDLSDNMPKTQITWLYPELFKAWEAGQMGMIHTGSYYTANAVSHGLNNMKRTVPVVFPKGPSAEKPQAMVGAVGFSIIKGSKNKEAAWKVLEIIMSPGILGKWAGSMHVPAVNYLTKDKMEEGAKAAYPNAWQEHLAIVEGFKNIADKYGVQMPKILGQPQMEKVVQGAMIKMIDKKLTPEQTYDEIRKGIEQVKASVKK